ncbi:mitogen-activated protein kinase kinase kinase 21 [Actinidia rufa]|uniref:Mitogen-activated protein kinase kinase kinase 21 n=1 Tax=Actinidia rufa TaxID=165716 RepID=A0A7J0FZ81_9ERIC|nr:mitogen-activated protein kinase kinase kinase 21 [Actinidia rufa]
MKRKREDEFQCETVEEVKQRSTDKCGGDGVTWFRGSMIGKGSFGSVYLANLKKPRSRFGCFPAVMAVKSAEISVSGSIQKEREALSNIGRCPNVIRCFGDEITTGENGEMVYNLLLEFGSGGTLADLIKKSGGSGLSESDVRYYARSILRGINHIHKLGYVHCDLKPENILLLPKKNGVGAKFKVKIGDFGLAKRASQNKKRKLDPYMRGTPMYLSPEVVTDCIQEPPSDIWAFGCIVLEMLTGKPLWFGKQDMDAEALLRMIGEGYESPKIPDEISREGREFFEGLFFEEGDDEECSSSFYPDDYCYETVDEFLFSSWSEEGEEIDSQYFLGFSKEGTLEGQEGTDTTGSITASSLEDVISTSKQVSANTVQHCSNTFPIRSGG